MSLHLIKKLRWNLKEFPCRTGESNLRPTDPKSDALPTELSRHLLWSYEILKFIHYNFAFCSTCSTNAFFFAMAGIQSVWFYKKLCYKTLLLFYIDIFQFSFKHWYIFHFAFCSTNAVFSLWLIFTQNGFIRNCGIFSFLMHY